MSECKAQIDPIEFGQIKADNETHKDHTKTVNEKLATLEKKVDSLKWYIVGGLILSPMLSSEAKDALIALGKLAVNITYAK